MIRFLDGPAADAVLTLRRAPLLLRVVIGPRGAIDALDQLDDEPRPRERIHVYRRTDETRRIHLKCARGSGLRSGWYLSADYRLHAEQPDEEVLRSTERWRSWAMEQTQGNNTLDSQLRAVGLRRQHAVLNLVG